MSSPRPFRPPPADPSAQDPSIGVRVVTIRLILTNLSRIPSILSILIQNRRTGPRSSPELVDRTPSRLRIGTAHAAGGMGDAGDGSRRGPSPSPSRLWSGSVGDRRTDGLASWERGF